MSKGALLRYNEYMKRNYPDYTFGLILFGIGLFMLFKNVNVNSFHFYTFHSVNTGGVIIFLLILTSAFYIAKGYEILKYAIYALVILLVISIILGIHVYLRPMSLFDLILILAPITIGIGLMLQS